MKGKRSLNRAVALLVVAALAVLAWVWWGRPGGTEVATPVTVSVAPSPYIFAWVGDGSRKQSDFLAVLDADPGSDTYGRLITTLPVDATGTMPHHTEYEFPAGGVLLASGWAAGRTFLFDLSTPTAPRLAGSFGAQGGYSYPHSFARLSNGNVLAVFQGKGEGYAPPGALAELDAEGRLLRASGTAGSGLEPGAWPYSLEVDEERDRVIVVSTPMGMPAWARLPRGSWPREKINATSTRHVQVFRLSDLKVLHTLTLPDSGQGNHHEWPAEPRLLPDGSVYVNTFRCGLYRITGLDGAGGEPKVDFVQAFPGGATDHTMCAVPVLMGKYWIQPAAAVPGLIALDVSDAAKPVEVSRLNLESLLHMPHWVAADRRSHRLLVTGDGESVVVVVNLDPQSGALSLDENFRDEVTGKPGVDLSRTAWPHGGGGKASVHGTLFGPR
jgi:hypothetical protein